MANIAFDEVICFMADSQKSSLYLGHSSNNNNTNHVLRLKFTTPSIGSSLFSFEMNNVYWYPLESGYNLDMDAHNNDRYFLFAISESADEYKDYNPASSDIIKPYDGVVQVKNDNTVDASDKGWYSLYSDTINKILLPNKEYYLWLFPNFKSHYYYWYFSGFYTTIYNCNLDGSAGLIRIQTKDGEYTTMPIVKDGDNWKQLMPIIKNDGLWDICS